MTTQEKENFTLKINELLHAFDCRGTAAEANDMAEIVGKLSRYALNRTRGMKALAVQDHESADEYSQTAIKIDSRIIEALDKFEKSA